MRYAMLFRHRRVHRALLTVTSLVAGAAPASAGSAFEREAVVVTGSPETPGSRLIFGQVFPPDINEGGRVIFGGSFDIFLSVGVTNNNNAGVWYWSTVGLTRVAREGRAAPGTLGVFETFEEPHLSDNERVAFLAELRLDSGSGIDGNNNEGVWIGFPSAIGVHARAGSPLPGVTGAVLENFHGRLFLSNTGIAAFRAFLTDELEFAERFGVWGGAVGALEQILRAGGPAPGVSGAMLSFVSLSALNDGGEPAIGAGLEKGVGGVAESNDTVLYTGRPPVLLTREADIAFPFHTIQSYEVFTINNAGQAAVELTYSSIAGGGVPDPGIWTNVSGAFEPAAKALDAIPGLGGLRYSPFSNAFTGLVINAAGEIAFTANIDPSQLPFGSGSDLVLCAGLPGQLRVVARTADPVPGFSGLSWDWELLSQPSMNASGDLLFEARVAGPHVGANNNDCLWYYHADSDAFYLVAREGDLIDVDNDPMTEDLRTISEIGVASSAEGRGSGGQDGRRTPLNDAGQCAYLLTLQDPINGQTGGVFVSTFAPPSCDADLDGDGAVGSGDLGALLAAWGQAGPADLDGDGTVGSGDLGALLAAWGPC